MATLTMRIDDRMETELSKLAEATHRTKSDLAREMLRRQIAIRRFQDLRAKAVPYAEAAGYLTDEDVFKDAS
jgi:predicted transcriptional regulator